MRDILPAPEHQTREGQDHTTEAAADEVGEDDLDSHPSNRRSRIRRAAAADDDQVRGLDEEDEQQADDGAATADEQQQHVEEEEGREAETEQIVNEAVEMRKAGKRRAIVEDEEAEGEQHTEGAATEAAEDEAVEMNVSQ